MTTEAVDLYRQLFGEGEDAIGELDEAENQGENCECYIRLAVIYPNRRVFSPRDRRAEKRSV
jgi:hypothetical protein